MLVRPSLGCAVIVFTAAACQAEKPAQSPNGALVAPVAPAPVAQPVPSTPASATPAPLASVGDANSPRRCDNRFCREVLAAKGELLGPNDLRVDDTNLYFVNAILPTIMRLPKAGGQVTPFIDPHGANHGFALDATSIYVASSAWQQDRAHPNTFHPSPGASVDAYSKGEDSPSPRNVFHLSSAPTAIAVDATYVYVATYENGRSAMLRAPKTGGPPAPFAEGGPGELHGLVVDDAHACWIADGPRGESPQDIVCAPTAGGKPTPVVRGYRYVTKLVLDGRRLVFSNSYHELMTVPVAGGKPEVLAKVASQPYAAAVSRGGVFFTTIPGDNERSSTLYWVGSDTASVTAIDGDNAFSGPRDDDEVVASGDEVFWSQPIENRIVKITPNQ